MINNKSSKHAETPDDFRLLTPNLPSGVLNKLAAFIAVKRIEDPNRIAPALRKLYSLWSGKPNMDQFCAAVSLFADLIEQGWQIHVLESTQESDLRVFKPNEIFLQAPGLQHATETRESARQRIRAGLLSGRNRQLDEPAVKKFISLMHSTTRRDFDGISIKTIIDDGAALADLLTPLSELSIADRTQKLQEIFQPEIQICESGKRCDVTGHELADIWRYFRYTWSLEYRPIPGRQIPVLIRNRARQNRPIMGIALLASPVAQLGVRDEWVGWTHAALYEYLDRHPEKFRHFVQVFLSRIDSSISETRWDDLVSPEEIHNPKITTILRLEQKTAGAVHQRFKQLQQLYEIAEEEFRGVTSAKPLTVKGEAVDWRVRSQNPLFVKKRSELLSKLLKAKSVLLSINWASPVSESWKLLKNSPDILSAIKISLKEFSKAGISSQILDLSVCGSVAPYNTLLGGKLVTLLMTSDEIIQYYRNRYSGQSSEISSSMAGRPVYRPAELKILTTTSLYGSGSSQYNRLRLIKAAHPELIRDICWSEVDQTQGWGSVHLSSMTQRALRAVSERHYGARKVNHVFGEGSGARMREARQALAVLGIDPEKVLRHSTPRLFYACELHEGAREELLGLRPATRVAGNPSSVIAKAWIERWLNKRVADASILNKLANQTPETSMLQPRDNSVSSDEERVDDTDSQLALPELDTDVAKVSLGQ